MAATRLADVIIPDLWNGYTIDRTAELSEVFRSGLVGQMTELGTLAGEGGNVINLPFWNDLTGADEVISGTGTQLTVNNITSGQDKAVIFARGKAWGTNELAAHLSGDDPAGAIGDLVAAYWARRFQAVVISILKGLFASGGALASTHMKDISGNTGSAAVISATAALDAQQLLGDAKDRLTAWVMHSATETVLTQQDLIDFEPPSEGRPRTRTFLGKPVVVDDGVPVAAGVYDTYLFGPGAIGFANVSNSRLTMTETDRDTLAGEDILINRRHFVLHPRGVKWAAADPTGGGATNTTCEAAATWSKVWDDKNIRIVCLRHKIA